MDEIVGITYAKAMQVELALKRKDIETAQLLNKQLDSYDLMPPLWFVYVPQLTPVKLKLAINTTKSIAEALQMLTEIEKTLRQTNKKTILIDVLILQALALKAQEKEKEAVLKITEALSLSSMGNCIRTYVDYGIELKELIAGLSETNENREHINIILEAINDRESCQQEKLKSEPLKKLVPSSAYDVSERLSHREVEVLNLVAQGLRNKEISDQLFIQTDTVKKHLKNVFGKLQVSNRIIAVKKAEELGLIEKT